MRTFSTESVFNKETAEWEELYFINAEEVDFETYCDEQENEPFEDEDDDEDCGACDNFMECTTDKYVDMLQEACCPECTKNILAEYLSEVLNHLGFFEED